MNCKEFELTASAYLDRQLDEREMAGYRLHLASCADCRVELIEVEALSLSLKNLAQPEVPTELRSYVLNSIARESSEQMTVSQRLFDWLLKLNPVPVSYATGAMVSAVLFLFLLSGVKPIPIIASSLARESAFPAVSSSLDEYKRYNDIESSNDANANQGSYQLPRVLETSPLVSFGSIAYQKPGNENMAALIEIEPDGSAKLVDVLDEPSDPRMVEQLWWSLNGRTFQPAIVNGRAVTTRIVLFVEKVDVGG